MKEMPLRRQADDPARPAASVGVVPDHRVPDGREVHANLVRAPAVQVTTEQVGRHEARQPRKVGARRAPGCHHGHPQAVVGIASERLVHRDRVVGEMPPAEGGVPSHDPPLGDGLAQHPQRPVRLGHDHQPRGVLVEPVNQPGSLLTRPVGERLPAPLQRVHQRPRPVARRGMHHHAGRLVDDQQRLVLERHRQGNLLGEHLASGRRRHVDRDPHPALGAEAGALAPLIHQHSPLGHQRGGL